jgi:hypothetical protein
MTKRPKSPRIWCVEPAPVPRVEVYPDHIVVVEMLTREDVAKLFAPTKEGNTDG